MLKRSVWKGPFISGVLFNEIRVNNPRILKTTSRASVVLPFLLGKTVQIHNGKFFIPLFIREEMIGHRLGEFVPTRLRHIYKKKKKDQKNKNLLLKKMGQKSNPNSFIFKKKQTTRLGSGPYSGEYASLLKENLFVTSNFVFFIWEK